MFRIRPEQLVVLQAADADRFLQDTVEMVAKYFPGEVAELCGGTRNTERLRTLVGDCIDAALGYGLDDEADIERFVELSMEFGPGFEKDGALAWVGELLAAPASSGTAKIEAVEARLGEDQ